MRDYLSPRSDFYRHPLKVWPYDWTSLGLFAAAWAVMTALWTVVGLAVVNWLEPSGLGQRELALNEWFEERRSETLDDIAHIASLPSDTIVTIVAMAVLVVAAPLIWRRWHDWAFLLGALVLEVAVYLTSNFLVGRPRPPVDRLEEIFTNSFPSGHVAAAVTLYLGLTIITFWHTENRLARGAVVTMVAVIPVVVAVSRLYLGVHYLTDVIAGAILGVAAVTVALQVARRGLRAEVAESDEIEPPHTASLDVTDLPAAEQR